MSALVWKDPPPDQRTGNPSQRGRIQRVVAELQAHPGKWALVKENAWPGNVYRLKQYGCEVRTRQVAPGTGNVRCDIYARWPEDAS